MKSPILNLLKWLSRGPLPLSVLMLAVMPVVAQKTLTQTQSEVPMHAQAQSSIRQTGPTDPAEMEVFIDQIVNERMAEDHIPGAVVVVVRDGEIFFAKGYGFADLENQVPVTPDTIFRAGSISKLLTATAVMQLHERGLLDLHADVNTYLTRFQIESPFSEPVTLHHLLTHTGGFGDIFIGGHAGSAEVQPLGDYLAERMPPPAYPPGEMISYSDHGMTLAGHIVEEISGLSFAEYVDQNIVQPLGMARSGSALPPELRAEVAIGYDYKNGVHHPYPYDFINIAPAAGFDTTAMDIACFMIAHLQDGRYGDAQILRPATAQMMHQRQATNHPMLRGRAYSFSEWLENNQRAIWHDGGMPGVNSRLFLLPEHNLGFFIAWNNNAGQLKLQFTSKFLDRYFPDETVPTPPQPSPDFAADTARYTGYYHDNRCSRHTLEKTVTLFEQIPIRANPSGALDYGTSGQWQLMPVEPLLFQWSDGDGYVAFREDPRDHITHMFIGTGSYEKVRWYETYPFQIGLLAFMGLAFLSGVVISLLVKFGLNPFPGSPLPGALLGIVSGLNLVFLIGFALVFFKTDQWVFTRGLPTIVLLLLALPILATLLTLGFPVFTVRGWLSGGWPLLSRIYYTIVTFASLVYVWFLTYWNLLGYKI